MAIPNADTVKVESNLTGEKIALTIAREADAHIMSVVTNLYADPEKACVREYSTNARDSHTAAGVTRPIEVRTPSTLKPLLEIIDYGEGMDDSDLREMYSQYGASSKRESNEAVGMLGLGCKSALAYTDTFTLVSVKGGKQYTCQVSRDQGGGGSVTITDVVDSDAPNGVRVQIPARRDNSFREKAHSLFQYWPKGSVLVDGEEPDTLDGEAIGECVVVDWQAPGYYNRHEAEPRVTVVMGGVPYPAPDGYDHDALKSLSRSKGVVITLPIGSVSFAPSRESLLDGPGTRKVLDAAMERFARTIRTQVTAEIETADSHTAAALTVLKYRDMFGERVLKGVTYKGEAVPITLTLRNGAAQYWLNEPGRSYRGGDHERYQVSEIPIDTATRCVWVLSFTNETWTKAMREKLLTYLQAEGKSAGSGVVCMTDADTLPQRKWLGKVTAVEWETVRKWRDPSIPKGGGKGNGAKAGTYPVYLPDGTYDESYPAKDIDPEQYPVYFTRGGRYAYGRGRYTDVLPKGYIVALNENRVEKFKRLFPTAVNLIEAAEAAAQKWYDSTLSQDQQDALHLPCESPELWKRIDSTKVKDADLKRYLSLVVLSQDKSLKDRYREWRPFLPGDVDTTSKAAVDLYQRVRARYPLIEAAYGGAGIGGEHLLAYVNAVHTP